MRVLFQFPLSSQALSYYKVKVLGVYAPVHLSLLKSAEDRTEASDKLEVLCVTLDRKGIRLVARRRN